MSLIVGFMILLMLLFLSYTIYRLLVTKALINLLFLCLQLFSISLAIISFINDVEPIEPVEGIYILFGVILPGVLLTYDYFKMSRRLKMNGVVNKLIERPRKSLEKLKALEGNNINFIYEELVVEEINKDLQSDESNIIDNIKKQLDYAHECISRKDFEKAFGIYKFISDILKDSPSICYNFANLCYRLERFEEAEKNYEKAISLIKKMDKSDSDPKVKAYKAYYNLGNTQFKMARYKKAVESYKEALKEYPGLLEAIENISMAFIFLGKVEAAIEYCNSMSAEFEDKSRVHYLMGRLYFKAGKYEDSAEELRECLKINPKFAVGYKELGKVLAKAGNYNEAIDVLKKYIKAKPFDSSGYYNIGTALYHFGKCEEAVKYFKLAVEIDPEDYKSYYNLGVCLDEMGNGEEAASFFKKVIEIKPDFLNAYNNLGILLSTMEKYKEAIDVYIRGLKKNPEEYSLYYNLGVTLAEMGRYSEAIEAYKNALDIKPDEYKISYHLSRALIQTKKYDEALKVLSEAAKIKPLESEVFYNLAIVYSYVKKHDSAIKNLRKAIELDEKCKKEARFEKAFSGLRTNNKFKELVS